jgi:hypothetical protein
MYNELNLTPKTRSPLSLIGPKLNGALVRIAGDLDAPEWTAFVSATFTGTRLDQAAAEHVANALAKRITNELDFASHEVMVTTTCPCCFQILLTTSDPLMVDWIQGEEETNPIGLLIECIHDFWMSVGCYDGPASDEPCNECSARGSQASNDSSVVRVAQAKGPSFDI